MKELYEIKIDDDELNALNSLKSWLNNNNLEKDKKKSIIEAHCEKYNINSIKISNYGLRIIPEELRKFTKLKTLDLSDNFIEELPPWIDKMLNLEYLKLDSNLLKDLNPNFKNLRCLTVLSLNNNKFRRIPLVINEIPLLREVYFSNNNLDSFYGCSSMRFFDVIQSQVWKLATQSKKNWLFPKKVNEWLVYLAQNQNKRVQLKQDSALHPILQNIWDIYQKSILSIIQDFKNGHNLTDIEQERLIIEMTTAEWPELQPVLSPDSELYKKIVKHMEIWHFLGYD